METIQVYLRRADRERLLNDLANYLIEDEMLLLEMKDRKISEIQDSYKNRMNTFIDSLLLIDAVETPNMVFYMCDSVSFDRYHEHWNKTICLVDIEKIRKDIYAPGYCCDFMDWKDTLGCYVADNKITQDYIFELLAQYLIETSSFGIEPKHRENRINEIFSGLEKAGKDVEEGRTHTADEVLEKLRQKYGLPVKEKDETKEKLRSEITNAEYKFSRYCHLKERKIILESLGYDVPLC